MSTEISDLIASLRNGTMSLEEVAQRFRERSWPRNRAPEPLRGELADIDLVAV